MARPVLCLLAFVISAHVAQAQLDIAKIEPILRRILHPKFDLETLGMQLLLTDWEDVESKKELYRVAADVSQLYVSPTCRNALAEWIHDITQKETYTFNMIDAFGKPPAGIMLGHILLFGHFDQCLNTRRKNETSGEWYYPANYCVTRVNSTAIRNRLPALPAYAMCLPKGCDNSEDASAFFNGIFGTFNATRDISASKTICVTPLAKNAGFFLLIALMGIILGLVLLASCVHCKYSVKTKDVIVTNGGDQSTSVQIYETKNGKQGALEQVHTSKKHRFSYSAVPAVLKPILCWHIFTNIRLLFSNSQEGEIRFLHGVRAFTTFWIILGNVYLFGRKMIENTIMFHRNGFSIGHQLIMNFGYAFDGLFLVTGLLVTYVILRDMQRNDGKINWALIYFHRWWRLTPVYVFVMLFYVYVLPYGIESPFKLIIAQEGSPMEYCKSHWWTNVLYINNFFPTLKSKQCMYWTWFLALDMQFFLIAPLIILALYKARNLGLGIIATLVVACVGTTMGLIASYGLPLNWMEGPLVNANETGFHKDVDYVQEKPYTRITPFVIGIALGYMFVAVPEYKLPGRGRMLAIVGWCASTALAITLLLGFSFSGWNYNPTAPTDNMTLVGRIAFGGLQRLGWSLVLSWVIFACYYGYGGVVEKFLALPVWRAFSNLTYGAYLVHLLTIQMYFASQRHMLFFSNLNFTVVFLAQLFMSYIGALIIALLVEVPLLRLESLVVRRSF